MTSRGGVVVDADLLIDYIRGIDRARSFLDGIRRSTRVLSAVVVMEVLNGCKDRREMRHVRRFLDGEFPEVVHVTEEISRRATTLVERHTLAHRLRPADALIAGTALTLNASLATGNERHFRVIKGLKVVAFR